MNDNFYLILIGIILGFVGKLFKIVEISEKDGFWYSSLVKIINRFLVIASILHVGLGLIYGIQIAGHMIIILCFSISYYFFYLVL